ncbi:hypothetical protein BDQ17DRAFT_1256338, partial [Cyathus striatus]
ITQLTTGHVALNTYLHRIGKVESPLCEKCDTHSPETVDHFLLRCTAFLQHRKLLLAQCAPRRQHLSLRRILSNAKNLAALATYVNATNRLRQTLGFIPQ